jgi:hypothetical protein
MTNNWIKLHINMLKPELYEIGAGVLNAKPRVRSKNIVYPTHTSKSTV